MTDSALDISVVVVTFNSAHCIEHCLTTITERLRPLEIVVVDNASADGSADAARRAAPEAIVIDSGENLGFGRACNLGAERARCTTVLFVNPDVGITAVDRAELEAVLGRPQLGLLVPALASSHDSAPAHQVFPYRPWRRTIVRQTWAYLRPRELQHAPRPARSAANAWAAAALLAVRREEFVAVGGFDRRFFLYGEDLDLSRRYRDRGFELRLTDSLVGHHAQSTSSSSVDSLRVMPLAWSLLGTIEYLSIWEGDRVAARAAASALRTFRLQRRLLGALRLIPGMSARARRKAGQVEEIEGVLVAHAAAGPPRTSRPVTAPEPGSRSDRLFGASWPPDRVAPRRTMGAFSATVYDFSRHVTYGGRAMNRSVTLLRGDRATGLYLGAALLVLTMAVGVEAPHIHARMLALALYVALAYVALRDERGIVVVLAPVLLVPGIHDRAGIQGRLLLVGPHSSSQSSTGGPAASAPRCRGCRCTRWEWRRAFSCSSPCSTGRSSRPRSRFR